MGVYDAGIPGPLADDASQEERQTWERRYGGLATNLVSLEAFTRLTYPGYQCKWFHRRICEAMDRLITGESPRVMVFAPWGHGKSELTSRRLPAYVLGLHPEWHVLAWSNTFDLAKAMSRDVQGIMDTEVYHQWFPRSRLLQRGEKYKGRRPKRTALYFELAGADGRYRGSGVKTAILGYRYHCGIIDDPVAKIDEALSSVVREKVWNEYTGGFAGRQFPQARVLITMTRFHTDDLAGRLLRDMKNNPGADSWDVVEFQAIRETHGGLLVPSEKVTA